MDSTIVAVHQLPSTSSSMEPYFFVSSTSRFHRRYRRSVNRSVICISKRSKMAIVKATSSASSSTSTSTSSSSRVWRERKQTVETIGQLKQLVPTVPKDEQVSRFELLQHVIDYIVELQRQLSDPLTVAEDREP